MPDCLHAGKICLIDWITIGELDAGFSGGDSEELNVDLHIICASNIFHLILELEFVTRDAVLSPLVGEVFGEGADIVQWLAR